MANIKSFSLQKLPELLNEEKEQMKKGYSEMGRINLSLAEESLLSDEIACEIYEKFLSESE